MISIDSQIWIYYFDPNAPESPAVTRWLEGKPKENNRREGGALEMEDILLSAIIPIEVAHTLYKALAIAGEEIDGLLQLFLSHKQIHLVDVSPLLVWEAIRKLKATSQQGIGGRDALILATMDFLQVETIASHDKSMLRQQDYARIDPVFQPPLILAKGDVFDPELYQKMLKEQYGTPQ